MKEKAELRGTKQIHLLNQEAPTGADLNEKRASIAPRPAVKSFSH